MLGAHYMNDEEIIAALRASRPRSAVELAELLDRLTNGGLSAGTMITFFKRAFPEIPLRVCLEAAGWKRLGGKGLSDEEFNEFLGEWIGGQP